MEALEGEYVSNRLGTNMKLIQNHERIHAVMRAAGARVSQDQNACCRAIIVEESLGIYIAREDWGTSLDLVVRLT